MPRFTDDLQRFAPHKSLKTRIKKYSAPFEARWPHQTSYLTPRDTLILLNNSNDIFRCAAETEFGVGGDSGGSNFAETVGEFRFKQNFAAVIGGCYKNSHVQLLSFWDSWRVYAAGFTSKEDENFGGFLGSPYNAKTSEITSEARDKTAWTFSPPLYAESSEIT
jgi:hypothetical protein